MCEMSMRDTSVAGLVTTSTVLVAVVLGPSAPAVGQAPAGPLGVAQTQTWKVPEPLCSITQAWQKAPGALHPQSVTFTGTVSCASVPPNLVVDGEIDVYDVAPGAAGDLNSPPVLTARASMGPADSPASFSLRPVLSPPKAGHDYDFQFLVSFVDTVDSSVEGVSGTPPQCTTHTPDPLGGGPPNGVPPSVDCQFLENVAIP
jgi:hypothetical protein